MNLIHLSRRIANSLALALALAMVGCGESPDMRDQRLAEFARHSMNEQQKQNARIADQSKAVVDESHQLAQAAKELVELDAQARRELLAAQSSLTSQLSQQQSVRYVQDLKHLRSSLQSHQRHQELLQLLHRKLARS